MPQVEREHRLEEAARARQESLEGERYPILASLVSPRELVPILCRDEGKPLRAQLRGAYATFARRAAELYDAAQRPASPVADVLDRVAAGGAVSPGAALRPVCSEPTVNVGPAWTEIIDPPPSHPSTLFVPSTLALHANMACPDVCTPRSDCLDKAVDSLAGEYRQVLSTSKAIEELDYGAITSALVQAQHGNPDEPPISSIYFISPEGITRTIPAFATDDVLAHYMSNGASYFAGALQRVDPGGACGQIRTAVDPADKIEGFVTYPYLEIQGGGLIETYCAPIDIVRGDQRKRETSTLGVLCSDIHHAESEVLRGLTEASAALDISVVRIWDPPARDRRAGGDGRGDLARTARSGCAGPTRTP